MRLILLLFIVMAAGCSSPYSDNGNVTQTALSDDQMQIVAADMAQTLFSRYGSRAVFSFPHSAHNRFATHLATALRAKGIGVNEQPGGAGYDSSLRYQLINLNPQQFYSQMNVSGMHFNRLWSVQNNILAPLTVQTQGGMNVEG